MAREEKLEVYAEIISEAIQLQELSNDTLKSYRKKANAQKRRLNNKVVKLQSKGKTVPNINSTEQKSTAAKSEKRYQGSEKARMIMKKRDDEQDEKDGKKRRRPVGTRRTNFFWPG